LSIYTIIVEIYVVIAQNMRLAKSIFATHLLDVPSSFVPPAGERLLGEGAVSRKAD
jgi:hypothetical protein